jgi:hypothetical protein
MKIDFDQEITEVSSNLDHAEGYLDCEKIITRSIKKKLDKGFDDEKITMYLEKLSVFLSNKIETNPGNADCYYYRYAAGFVETLLKMPYWRSWIKNTER